MRVELGERSYPLHAEPLGGLGSRLAELRAAGRVALVSNPVVDALYGDAAVASLEAAGFSVARVLVPDGEANKTLDTWRELVEALLDLGLDRGCAIVALGGGVTGDIAGFAAATVLRGLPLVQVPTTLLAMVDSSVGGKTGVNTARGKNLVGAFHQPLMVLAALDTLVSLDQAEYRCGLGEVVKHALIADTQLFSWLEDCSAAVLAREPSAVRHMVERCCAIKAGVVQQDERESGLRAVLNCGHTLGHAIEKVLGFGAIRHGEAVGLGLLGEATWAAKRGLAPAECPERLAGLLLKLGLPVRVHADPEALVRATAMDKKRRRGRILIAHPTGIGGVALAEVETADLLDAALAVSQPPEEAL